MAFELFHRILGILGKEIMNGWTSGVSWGFLLSKFVFIVLSVKYFTSNKHKILIYTSC